MALFDHFRSASKQKMLNKEERENLSAEIQQNMITVLTQQSLSKQEIMRNIDIARRAIAEGDAAKKAGSYNTIRFNLALYRYMSAMYMNLTLMKSNLSMQNATLGFADIVKRISSIKIPAGTFDFDKLVAKALHGLKPIDISGLERMTKSLLDGATCATTTAQIEDSYLDDLVSGRTTIDDVNARVEPIVLKTEAVAEAAAPAPAEPKKDVSAEELLKLIDNIAEGI